MHNAQCTMHNGLPRGLRLGGRRARLIAHCALWMLCFLPLLASCNGRIDAPEADSDTLSADTLKQDADTLRMKQQKFRLSSEREARASGVRFTGWQIVAAKSLRVKNLKGMKSRMVVVSRDALSDTLLTRALKENNLPADYVYRPQIDDLELRVHMLVEGQIDAALLPAPYAAQARAKGGKVLYSFKAEDVRLKDEKSSSESPTKP